MIRAATSEDFDAVTALLEELGRGVASGRVRREKFRAVYESQLADPRFRHLVAVGAGKAVVGFCSLELRERLNQSSLQAWIPDLVVHPDTRGDGHGRALLAEAQRIAREEGCWSLELESGHQRTVAHRLYDSAGLVHTGRAYAQAFRSRVEG